MQRRFSTIVDNGEATHQDRSGRCWLFSSLNVARFVAKKNMNLKEFEFSQNYAMYYDKLERVNYFLKDVAALVAAGEPSDSRLMQHLLADVMGDGGQWTMAMNVYKKYGAVPKDLFPETESSKNTGEMNIQLRHMLHTAVAHMYAADGDASKVEAIIADATAAGHRILTIHLGEPPVSFDWEWTDKDGEFHRDGEITPVEFWKKYVGPADLEDYVCLVDDPRTEHAKGKKIGIEHLGNVAGGDATEYLNVPNQFMKDCVRRVLVEQGIPVWFGAECGPMMDREAGAWPLTCLSTIVCTVCALICRRSSACALVTRPWITRWPLLVWMWLTTVLLPVAGVWRILGAPRLPIRATLPCPMTGSPSTSTRSPFPRPCFLRNIRRLWKSRRFPCLRGIRWVRLHKKSRRLFA